MPGRASGVWRAALWNRTMDPGCTLEVTRWVISAAEMSFQSRLSPLAADSSGPPRALLFHISYSPNTSPGFHISGYTAAPILQIF